MKNRKRWWSGIIWSRQSVWVCGGLLLAGALVIGSSFKNRAWTTDSNPPLMASNGPVSLDRLSMPWYIRSGQWQGDLRSLGALLKYLTDSDETAQTNVIPVKADKA
jgi:hypothetical protein